MGEFLTIAVDFDGVIADYDGWSDGQIGSPREDVIKALSILKNEGWRIIVYSCRASDEILSYLQRFQIPFDEVNQNSTQPTGGVKPVTQPG